MLAYDIVEGSSAIIGFLEGAGCKDSVEQMC